MKRLIAAILTLVLLLTSLPVTVFAETATVASENEDEYIYNSDLFYGYSTYLTETYNRALLSLEMHRMQTTNNIIHQDYINSTHFYESVVSQGLSIATDPAGTVKYFTDYVGASNFQFNDELDKANVTFVKKLCETNLLLGEAGSLIKENNKYVKKMNGFLKAVQSVEKAGLLDEAYYEGLSKPEIYSTMFEQSMAYYKDYFTQINPSLSFNTQLHTALSEMTNALGGIATAADFTYALCLSLLMQDAQIELIQDIINTQPTTSTLYKGLTRLKNQLKNGWASYFINTFVKGKVYEQVVGKVSGNINGWIMGNWTSYYSAVMAVVKVVNTVVFEWILGADYGAYRSALMLDTYASDLCDSVKNKALTFQTAGFSTNDIEKYEILFNAYIAMSEASLDACQDLAIHNATYTETYLNEQLKLYNNDNIYTDYLDDVKAYILSIPKENRIITDYGTWNITSKTTICEGSDKIEANKLYFRGKVFNGSIYHPRTSSALLFVDSNNDLTITGNFKIVGDGSTFVIPKTSSLTILGNFTYEADDWAGGCTTIFQNYGELNVLGNADISGEHTYYWGDWSRANFYNYGKFKVCKNLTLYYSSGDFVNDGELICDGTFIKDGSAQVINNNLIKTKDLFLTKSVSAPYIRSCFKMVNEDSCLIVSGDFINDEAVSVCQIKAGLVVFDGSQQQEIKGLSAANVNVTNPCGIKYTSTTYLCGEFKSNGNPLDNNGYKTYVYDGFVPDSSKYGDLVICDPITIKTEINANLYGSVDVTLCENVNGDIFWTGGTLTISENCLVDITGNLSISTGNLTILENSIVSVYGDVILTGLTSSYGYSIVATTKYRLKNNGQFNVFGNVLYDGFFTAIENNGTIHARNDFSAFRVKMDKSSAKLIVGGNYYCGNGYDYSSYDIENIRSGEVIFNGTKQQSVRGLIAPVITLNNTTTDGVVFTTPINPNGLFNHKGNNFTLYNNGSGSTFVDYDGDGMKDNVDPEPTVGNPCMLYFESEDTEKGTVSLSEVETIGGTKIKVTATPTFKYDFAKWVNSAGETVSTSAEYTFVAKGGDKYTAIFTKRQQPIIAQTEGGAINVTSKAEIESEVKVTVTENDGYVYTEGSLAYNGIPIENGSFIMPDEAVTLTAEFVRNENYFALSDALITANGYTYQSYSKESFANLTAAINTAQAALVNNISAEESELQIALLQAAIDGLEEKFISSVTLKTTPVLYINVPDMVNSISVLVTYDNGTTLTTKGANCLIEGYDASVLGEQTISLTYEGFTGTVTVTVDKRNLIECTVSNIVDQIYDGVTDAYLQNPSITYDRTQESLTENVDYTVSYSGNTALGEALMILTGIGNYSGIKIVRFKIYCEHNYIISELVESTCIQKGYQTEVCTICKQARIYEEVDIEDLPESQHNYANNCDVSYYYTKDGANSLTLAFSTQTLTESNCDKIYIYDGAETLLGTYSGSALAGKKIAVSGDAVRIRLTTDSSVVRYGFSLDSITAYFDELQLPLKEHSYGEWSNDGASEGYVRRVCQTDGCDATEERMLASIEVEDAMISPGQSDVMVAVKLVKAPLQSAIFTVTAPEELGFEIVLNEAVSGLSVTDNVVCLNAENEEGLPAGTILFYCKLSAGKDLTELEDTIILVETSDAVGISGSVEIENAIGNVSFLSQLGDANVDGQINIIDALHTLQHIVGNESKINIANADMNGNGIIELVDVRLIVRTWMMFLS